MEGLVSEGFVGLFVVSQEGHWSWKENITKKALKYFGNVEPPKSRATDLLHLRNAALRENWAFKRLLYGPDINTKSEGTLQSKINK